WHFVLPPDPGPTSFWEVVAIAPEPLRQGKTNHLKTRHKSGSVALMRHFFP
ncbi:hypothetical protein M2282_006233, partial [Variovorax boronicumulans]|nr:hypothetical protein [Variovorax boronicumulans]